MHERKPNDDRLLRETPSAAGGFIQGHADKEVQVDDVRCRGIGLRQSSHNFVDGEKCLRVRAAGSHYIQCQLFTLTASPVPNLFLSTSVFNQNASHRAGRCSRRSVPGCPNAGPSPSTSRMYASCTSAVACSVWPGFSCAILSAASFRSSS